MMRVFTVLELVHLVSEPDAMADEKEWRIRAVNGELIVEAWNDARTAFTSTTIKRQGVTIQE